MKQRDSISSTANIRKQEQQPLRLINIRNLRNTGAIKDLKIDDLDDDGDVIRSTSQYIKQESNDVNHDKRNPISINYRPSNTIPPKTIPTSRKDGRMSINIGSTNKITTTTVTDSNTGFSKVELGYPLPLTYTPINLQSNGNEFEQKQLAHRSVNSIVSNRNKRVSSSELSREKLFENIAKLINEKQKDIPEPELEKQKQGEAKEVYKPDPIAETEKEESVVNMEDVENKKRMRLLTLKKRLLMNLNDEKRHEEKAKNDELNDIINEIETSVDEYHKVDRPSNTPAFTVESPEANTEANSTTVEELQTVDQEIEKLNETIANEQEIPSFAKTEKVIRPVETLPKSNNYKFTVKVVIVWTLVMLFVSYIVSE